MDSYRKKEKKSAGVGRKGSDSALYMEGRRKKKKSSEVDEHIDNTENRGA